LVADFDSGQQGRVEYNKCVEDFPFCEHIQRFVTAEFHCFADHLIAIGAHGLDGRDCIGAEPCITGSYSYFDEAMGKLRDAEEKLGDPDVSKIIARLTRRIQGQPYEAAEVD